MGLGARFSFYKACLALAVSEGRTYVDTHCEKTSDCSEGGMSADETATPCDHGHHKVLVC